MGFCTIAASKIKGTAREIYRIFYISLQWGFSLYTHRVCIQRKSLQVKPLKESHASTPHSTVLTAGETPVGSGRASPGCSPFIRSCPTDTNGTS